MKKFAAIGLLLLCSCAGLVTKSNSFRGSDQLTLNKKGLDIKKEVAATALKLKYTVQRDEADHGLIEIESSSSSTTYALTGGAFQATNILIDYSGYKVNGVLKFTVEVVGNLGKGDQTYAEKQFDEFKSEFLKQIGEK